MAPVRFGLAAKLFAVLLLVGAVGILLTGVLGYVRARDALEATIYNQLTAARQTKARQVENYFRVIGNELRLLGSTTMVLEAAHGFAGAVDKLDHTAVPPEMRKGVADWYADTYLPLLKRNIGGNPVLADYLPTADATFHLQDRYLVNNPFPEGRRALFDDAHDDSDYGRLHAVYQPIFRRVAATVGFFDMMLADPRRSRIVYAVAKETDFGASLNTGFLRQSNLASAVARCSTLTDGVSTCLEDFAPYAPSLGAPTAFMTTPVIDQGVVIGVLIAQLSIDEINRVTTGDRNWRREGFGATGETYIVGPDHRLRSASRFFLEDREAHLASLKAAGMPADRIDAIRRYGTPVLQQQVDNAAVTSGLAGIEGTGEVVGYRGLPTLASWTPLRIPGVNWVLISKIDEAEAFAPIERLRHDLEIVGAAALAVVLLVGAWFARSLSAPLRELTAGVNRFAAGDYAVKVAVKTRDEIGRLCQAFNGMVEELSEKNRTIEGKNRENEELLLNVLPAPIATRLRGGEERIADGFAEVTVLFADLVGFTAMSSEMPPGDVVRLLNGLFSRFDDAAHELGIEKIKTVGDAYMAVCGMPVPVANHAERAVRMAIRMIHITREHSIEHHVSMKMRIGINSGPVVAGVIGKSKYIYDLWGDTVNLASRMESGGLPDSIQVTRPVYETLKDVFSFEPRGTIEVKGKGNVEAWLLRL
jgi:class 3 adenylate cyclase